MSAVVTHRFSQRGLTFLASSVRRIVRSGGYGQAAGEMTPETEWRFLRLHIETAIALQIVLVTGEFRAGRFVRDGEWDARSWRRCEA